MDKVEITDFDISKYLNNKEIISQYLSQILSDGDMDEFIFALGNIAKAKGMSKVADDTGLGRESLYKTFNKGSKPKFETITKIMSSFGVTLQAV